MTHFIGNWGKLSLIFPLSKIMQLLYDQLAKEIGICRVTRLHANFLAQGRVENFSYPKKGRQSLRSIRIVPLIIKIRIKHLLVSKGSIDIQFESSNSRPLCRHLYFATTKGGKNNVVDAEKKEAKARVNLAIPQDPLRSGVSAFEAIPRYRGTTTSFQGTRSPTEKSVCGRDPQALSSGVPFPETLFLRPTSYWTDPHRRVSMVGSGCEPTLLRPPSCSGQDTIFYEPLLLGVHGLGRVLQVIGVMVRGRQDNRRFVKGGALFFFLDIPWQF